MSTVAGDLFEKWTAEPPKNVESHFKDMVQLGLYASDANTRKLELGFDDPPLWDPKWEPSGPARPEWLTFLQQRASEAERKRKAFFAPLQIRLVSTSPLLSYPFRHSTADELPSDRHRCVSRRWSRATGLSKTFIAQC